ncbi:hypothetical protein Nepgr_003302 [Nepenthes gracilis]|uniref:Uncharacterized protein n=1 Tax=Nepenthes gracilis TaxID=150966 RepID=A0AAD3RZ89_NEPGR|nr:hypothetical protein Nepgr_003302 [Nepenthes gracilis]
MAPSLPRRPRSTEEAASSGRSPRSVSDCLEPEDFNDVFGGPPRSVMSKKFPSDFTDSDYFYKEIFVQQESPVNKIGRRLPKFRIPSNRVLRDPGFYNDIFGSENERRSRSRSKSNAKPMSNSSSVLSSEDLSPFRPAIGEDFHPSSFASKLRPINVPFQRNSTSMMFEENDKQQGMPISYSGDGYSGKCWRISNSGYNSQRVPSPDTTSLEASVKISMDDVQVLELNTPSSVSTLCEDIEEDEVASCYVIEISSQRTEEADIDEAIKWAKGKFQAWSSSLQNNLEQHEGDRSAEMQRTLPLDSNTKELSDHLNGCAFERLPVDTSPEIQTTEEGRLYEKNMGTAELDENIKLWSAGREADIQLLLSTLHHILWPSSGWRTISLSNLNESSQVKRAYQKARLCLHPDKLQQRGATFSQKYIAQKAFSILQDAWTLFISQDVSFG